MYNYVFDKENNSVLITREEKELAKMRVEFNGGSIVLSMIEFSDDLSSGEDTFKSFASFTSIVCKDVKKMFLEKGVAVDSVLFGEISEVKELDQYLQGLDNEFSRDIPTKTNMR